MTAQDQYELCRKLGLTNEITSNPFPDYSLPFYQSIFKIMDIYADNKLNEAIKIASNITIDNDCVGLNILNLKQKK